MEELFTFLQTYGWQLSLIAIAGIVILGILKYCNVFSKLSEKTRHVLYLVISVGLSIIGAIIYLACVGQFTLEYVVIVASAILALNQTFYAIYDTTTLKELVNKLLDWIKSLLNSNTKSTNNLNADDTNVNTINDTDDPNSSD